MPRINFVSFTFLFAFGFGAFVGVGMSLLAIALATEEPETIVVTPEVQAIADAPTLTPTLAPTSTPSSTPVPAVLTRSTQQVRVGPDENYAVLGTLSAGSQIDLRGRDDLANWVAIEFPPGSSARGWIPVEAVSGVSLVQVLALDIVAVTLIDTTPQFPGSGSGGTIVNGNDGLPVDDATPGAASGTATPTKESDDASPFATPTPRTVSAGPADLSIGGYAVDGSGAVTVTVVNAGPGDIPAGLLAVQVTAGGSDVEFLRTGRALFAGDSVTLRTAAIRLTGSTSVSIKIDSERQLSDIDRSNNAISLTLTP